MVSIMPAMLAPGDLVRVSEDAFEQAPLAQIFDWEFSLFCGRAFGMIISIFRPDKTNDGPNALCVFPGPVFGWINSRWLVKVAASKR